MYCKALEIMTHMNNNQFKRIAFDIMDYNSDGFISEIDLFTYMGSTETKFFTKVMYDDFKIVNKALITKKIKIAHDDEVKVRIDKIKAIIVKQLKDDRLSSIRQVSEHMEANKNAHTDCKPPNNNSFLASNNHADLSKSPENSPLKSPEKRRAKQYNTFRNTSNLKIKSRTTLNIDLSHHTEESPPNNKNSSHLPSLGERLNLRSFSQEVPKPTEESEVTWDNNTILLNIAEDQSETVKLTFLEFKKLKFKKLCPNIIIDIIEYLTNISVENAICLPIRKNLNRRMSKLYK
jgi:hypothetical protein